MIKGGLSNSGSRAAASHTASLGGQKAIWEAALRQCNATQVENLEELSDAALAFSLLPAGEYRGCSIVGGGGALGIAAADAAESLGLAVPRLRGDLQAAILDVLPKPGSSATNPIDIANPFVKPEHIRKFCSVLRETRILTSISSSNSCTTTNQCSWPWVQGV